MAKLWLIEFVMTKVAEGGEAVHTKSMGITAATSRAWKKCHISSTLRATDIVLLSK